MRKILQCVPMNEVLKHPDDFLGYSYDYGLVGPAALGQVSATKGRQAVVALDENNAFTFIETPEYWWRFLGGPVVLCEDLPEEWTQGRWPPKTRLRPLYTRLPMGNTHAAMILLMINREAATRALRREKRWASVRCLNDVAVRAHRVALIGDVALYYIHIDDIAVIAETLEVAAAVREVIAAELARLGFVLKRSDPTQPGGRYIGLAPRCVPARWDPEPAKLGGLDRLLQHCAAAGPKDVAILDAALGIYV